MRAAKFVSAIRFRPFYFLLTLAVLFASVTALATRSPRAIPQTPCPSQADCDRLKAISDIAAAESAAAKAVADQAEADRAKDLAAADRLERDASNPDKEFYPRASDRVAYGQAKRAQAQGLRDKLANAKANADARAKSASDAAKAYQDCLDLMKACAPKETKPPADTPANSTGTTTVSPSVTARPYTWMVECKDSATTSVVVPQPSIADLLKGFWDSTKYTNTPDSNTPKSRIVNTWMSEDNWNYVLGRHQLKAGVNWTYSRNFNSGTTYSSTPFQSPYGFFVLPSPTPTFLGQPTSSIPSCTLNSQGGVTIGQYHGGFEPRLGFRYTGNSPTAVTPRSDVVNPLPLIQYFPIPEIPGLIPPLKFNTPDTNPPAPDDVIHRIVAPKFYIRQPVKYYIRPKEYYDYRSQYFWIYDGPGSPHYCAFDFPDALRSFPEIGLALAAEEASHRKRENFPAREQSRGQFQLASFRQPSFYQPSPFSESNPRSAPAPQNGASAGETAKNATFNYSIVSNGKSTGEAFQLQLLDTTGQVKSVGMRSGTVVEAIAPGVTQPVTAAGGGKIVTQPLNGFCLEFGKHPPAEGTQYRLADETTQQKFEPMRFISRAGEQMQEKKLFHPDSDPKAYTDAILQYALWSKLEGWNQEQFTSHFVQRTKENADALHVKWTNEMENALRAAAPGRWKDISEMLSEAQDLEKNSGQGRGGRRGGGGRGGRRGAARGD
jgi:hypothetical protein